MPADPTKSPAHLLLGNDALAAYREKVAKPEKEFVERHGSSQRRITMM
jgi:hypothetical protein